MSVVGPLSKTVVDRRSIFPGSRGRPWFTSRKAQIPGPIVRWDLPGFTSSQHTCREALPPIIRTEHGDDDHHGDYGWLIRIFGIAPGRGCSLAGLIAWQGRQVVYCAGLISLSVTHLWLLMVISSVSMSTVYTVSLLEEPMVASAPFMPDLFSAFSDPSLP